MCTRASLDAYLTNRRPIVNTSLSRELGRIYLPCVLICSHSFRATSTRCPSTRPLDAVRPHFFFLFLFVFTYLLVRP